MKQRIKRTGIVALLLPILIGCNSQDASNLAQDAGKIAKDVGKAAGNGQLATRVSGALAQRKGVSMTGLHVEADHGVVVISGHVRDANEKRLVRETAEGIQGVDKVDVSKLRTLK